MTNNTKGAICGCIGAVSYGMNPLCALNLYADGITPNSVLFYRFAFASVLLAAFIAVRRRSFNINLRQAGWLIVLGLLFAASSTTYFLSFNHMSGGVAATLVFAYPVMVALLMALFFGERLPRMAWGAILLSVAGIALLYRADDGRPMSTTGFVLIMISALTYALYIIVVNRCNIGMGSIKLTFYAMLVSVACMVLNAHFGGEPLQMLTTPREWFYAFFLGLVPTVVSLVTMAMAIHLIGSTPTAVMGALEPVTALAIGVCFLGDVLTPRLAAGIVLILASVIIIVRLRAKS